jgi:hypothetical protein
VEFTIENAQGPVLIAPAKGDGKGAVKPADGKPPVNPQMQAPAKK